MFDNFISNSLEFPFKKKTAIFYKIFIIFTCLLVFFGLIFYKTSVIDIFKYIYSQLFFVLLPGLFFCDLLKKFQNNFIKKITMSYGIGVALTIIEYFIFYSIDFKIGLYYFGPILSVLEIILIIRKNGIKQTPLQITNKLKEIPIQLWFILSILVFITFWGLTLANPMPDLKGVTSYNQDLLWTIGNTESLIRNFPPIDARLAGITFLYHYFVSVHLAVLGIVSKIDPVQLFFKFSQIGKLFFLVFSTYILGLAYFNSKKKAIYFTWIYFFTNCASLFYAFYNGYGIFLNINFVHLTNDPFGYELSIAFMFLAAALLIDQFKENKYDFINLLIIGLFTFAATGSKGPVGLILAGTLVVVCIISLIKNTPNKKYIFISTIIINLIFLGVFLCLLTASSNSLFLSPGFTVKRSILGSKLIYKIADTYLFRNILSFLLIPLHFIFFLPFASIPFIFWFYKKVSHLKKVTMLEFFIGGLAISGVLLTYLLGHSGNSQLYFIMISIPFIEICAIEWLSNDYGKLKNFGKIVVILSFIAATTTSIFLCAHQGAAGFVNLRSVINKSKIESEPRLNNITKYEYEGMKWLQENTDKGAIIAGDRWYIAEPKNDNTARYFYYSTFSDRQFFLEGWHYSNLETKRINTLKEKKEIFKLLFSLNENNKAKIMKTNNIDYLAVSRFSNSGLEINDEDMKLLFENRDIKIYGLK